MPKIRLLDLVEDSNEFTAEDLRGVPALTPWTVGGREIKVGGNVVGMMRVDRFPKGAEVEVPQPQADNLIALGLAELIA